MMRSITVQDIEGCLHTINLDHLTRISWGYDEDVDMLYVTEGAESAEIALKARSADSMVVFEAVTGISTHAKALNYLHENQYDNQED